MDKHSSLAIAAGHSGDVAGWQQVLDQVLGAFAGRFARVETRRAAAGFVTGLLADTEATIDRLVACSAAVDGRRSMDSMQRTECWPSRPVDGASGPASGHLDDHSRSNAGKRPAALSSPRRYRGTRQPLRRPGRPLFVGPQGGIPRCRNFDRAARTSAGIPADLYLHRVRAPLAGKKIIRRARALAANLNLMVTEAREWQRRHPAHAKKRPGLFARAFFYKGGAEGTRTPDPHTASVVRYQLRHGPLLHRIPGSPGHGSNITHPDGHHGGGGQLRAASGGKWATAA